jgi:hypothetical protein
MDSGVNAMIRQLPDDLTAIRNPENLLPLVDSFHRHIREDNALTESSRSGGKNAAVIPECLAYGILKYDLLFTKNIRHCGCGLSLLESRQLA